MNLLKWYAKNKRILPWRSLRDPYAIWVSEILLQQTTVAAVLGRFLPFLEQFPNVEALAAASEEEVLAALQGLGYYRRFRAMKRGAEVVVRDLGGELPKNYDGWKALPGIGDYTAGAIASIALNHPEAAVDGNVVRVMTRLLAIAGIHETPAAKRQIGTLVLLMMGKKSPSEFNQALFDLGATICLPAKPKCDACPMVPWCRAFQTEQVSSFPQRPPKIKMVDVEVAVLLVRRGTSFLMCRRPFDAKRMPNFRELPEVWLENEGDARLALRNLIEEKWGIEVQVGRALLSCKHTITKHRLTCSLYQCESDLKDLEGTEWVSRDELKDAPTSTITKKLLARLGDAS